MWPNVLVTAGSRRVALVRAFQAALARAGGGEVIVTDVNPLSPSVYLADRSYHAPLSSDPDYMDALLAICRQERVGLVVPTIDDELEVCAERAAAFATEGIQIAVSSVETTRVCNDKCATAAVLRASGIAAAATLVPADLPATPHLPLFIKPRYGRGSVGAFPIRTMQELAFFRNYVEDPVVQTYLDGPEFTVDVLCDFDGRPLSVVPRERVVIRAGVVDRGRTTRDPSLIDLGLACAAALPFVGAVNIQCRVVDGVPVVFEINPRFSGGIPLTLAAGADFPAMLVDLARGRSVASSVGQFQDDLWMTNYEASVFVRGDHIGFQARPQKAIAEVA